jgi:uncharacterized protein (DUF885 family)
MDGGRTDMKLFAVCWLLTFALATVAKVPILEGLNTSNAEDAKLAAFFKAYLDAEFRRHPSSATRSGDHRYDDRLDDLSPAAQAADLKAMRDALADLPKQVDYPKLTRAGQIDFEILKHNLNYGLWKAENDNQYENNPLFYNEVITDSVFLLLTQSSLPREQNVKNAASRIEHISAVLAAARQSLSHPPEIYSKQAIERNRGAISFYESGIFPIAGETPQLGALGEPCRKAVAALKEYQTFLEKELLPRSSGEWRIGKEKFARKLELELDAGLTAEDVIREAESEAARVEAAMVVVSRQLWFKLFAKEAVPPDDAEGRRTLVRRVLAELAKDHGSVDNLVTDARQTVARIKKFIRARDLLRLPEPDHCQVVEMPEFQRGFSVAYLNAAPPLDPKAASLYAVSPPPRDWDARTVQTYLEEYNRHMLQILTIHEAYPGHYVQLEYSNRCPSQIRAVWSNGVFAEGWAVYTEQTMLDEGYGDGDLALRLHQLKFYLRAVINAILDHRMHCGEMTDEQALDFLVNRGFQSKAEALGKIQRAKLSSCQLSTYFVGRTAFYRLRQLVQRELGDAFDLGRYHEAVLDFGSPPVKYMPELVRERLKQPR